MAKKRKAAKQTSSRPKSGSSRSKRSLGKRQGAMSTGDLFNPSGWFSTLIGSQSGRVIMAEVLVAAAGAAAAVLMASRTEAGAKAGQAIAGAGRNTAELMKEAAKSAAAAASEVLGAKALDAVGNAAKSMMGGREEEPSQAELSRKAMRLRRDHEEDMAQHDMAENARRYRERNDPH